MKPFDKIVYRKGNNPWNIAHFSHVSNDMLHTSEFSISLSEVVFFPFEGNEKLVGTTNNVEDEVFLPEGSIVYCGNEEDCALGWTISEFKEIDDDLFMDKYGCYYDYVIPAKDYDYENWEETKKHILKCRDGKVVHFNNN